MKIPELVRRAMRKAEESEGSPREADASAPRALADEESFRDWVRKKLEFIERQNRRLFFASSTYVGDYTAITWITSGQRIFVDTRDLGIGQHLMFKGFWEKTTNEALMSLLREDSVFVDVGAHYGYHTITAAQKVSAGRVLAVEPNPRLFGLATKSVRINGLRDRVELVNCAVADAPSTATFVTPTDDPALGHIAGQEEISGIGDTPRTEVSVKTLDELCAGLPPVDLVKIDVEGHEWQVLRAADETLAHDDVLLLVEYAPAHIERQRPIAEFHVELQRHGFTHAYDIDRTSKLVEASFAELPNDRNLRNVVFSKKPLQR